MRVHSGSTEPHNQLRSSQPLTASCTPSKRGTVPPELHHSKGRYLATHCLYLRACMHCPICTAENLTRKGKNPSFPRSYIYKCKGCRFAFSCPLPSTDELQNYYQSGFYVKSDDPSELQGRMAWANRRASSQLKLLQRFLPSHVDGLKAFEFGCSEGSMLSLLQNLGFDVYAYEPDSRMAVLANSRLQGDGRVVNALFQDEDFVQDSYDLIVSSHVLEHLLDPCNHLLSVKNALRKDGILFLEIPNQYALNNYVGIDAPKNGHLYFYSINAIKKLLARLGFEILFVKSCGFSVQQFARKNKPSNAQSQPSHRFTRILMRLRGKLKRAFVRSQSLANKQTIDGDTNDQFNLYFNHEAQQGQWIRIICKA
jgi:SAM-dependent methyltransferase